MRAPNTFDPRRLRLLLAPLALAAASGCAPLGANPGWVVVTSDPAGADVYAMGVKVGVTPIGFSQDAVFPTVFPSEKRALVGAVELRKTDCRGAMQRVSSDAVTRGLHVKLECGEAVRAEAGSARRPQNGPRQTETEPRPLGSQTGSIEARLRRVQELRDKGLLTEQEAREARQRLVGEL